MIKTTSQMNQFYATSPLGCATHHLIPDEDAKTDIFSLDQADAKQLLPPSFLVPATIEALKHCPRYRDIVDLVPGEADAFCAKHLARHGGIVLTSDSDLLVHDLADGQVVFFRDLHLNDKLRPSASCLLYNPRDISQRLRIPPTPGIRRLGYEVYRSSHTPVSKMVSNCSQPVTDEHGYTEFCQQYLEDDICPVPRLCDRKPLPIDRMDPRLSELALQFGIGQSEQQEFAKMFLPVLIENPMRSSAWEPSTPIRQLGYTILSWIMPDSTSCVQEYRRVQTQQQKGRSVFVLSKDLAQQVIIDLLHQMTKVEDMDRGRAPYWLVLCLTLDIAECHRQGKRSHALQTIREYAVPSTTSHGSKIPWDTVHLAYQVQASYYSFRMLQQILSVAPDDFQTIGVAKVKELKERVDALPDLTDFFDVRAVVLFLQNSREIGILSLLGYPIENAQKIAKEPASNSESSKKRKKSDLQHVATSKKSAKPATPRSKNIFSLLESTDEN